MGTSELTILVLAIFGGVIFFTIYLILSFERKLRDHSFRTTHEFHLALESLKEELRHQSSLFHNAQTSVGDRLEGATHLVAEVQNQLGRLEQAHRQILDLGTVLGKEVGSLQSILQAPKIRGGWGELFLGDLLEQVLGPDHYELQFPFKNGERVDAVVKLSQGMVPVDAKFPLENFRKFLSAQSDSEVRNYHKEFYKDVRRHIDQIAEKYVVPDEGTTDFALMYIPAENVYYETIIRDEDLGDGKSISDYAQAKKVIPVSPNTLYVYLCSIVQGLKGLKIESHAKEILLHIQQLAGDLDRFDEEFRKMGVHLKNTVSTYEKATRQFDRLHDKITLHELVGSSKVAEEKLISS